MTAFVVKANNRYKAVPQRDAVNEVMDAELKADGSFDFDDMLKNHPNEYFVVLSITYFQITKNKSFISPPEICVKASAKYENMFVQLEKPILHAIKRAIESGDHYNILYTYKVKSFFMTRGVFTDIPDNLKEKAIVAAKIVHGNDYDTTALENNEVHLDTILGKDRHSIMYFNITKFEFRE